MSNEPRSDVTWALSKGPCWQLDGALAHGVWLCVVGHGAVVVDCGAGAWLRERGA